MSSTRHRCDGYRARRRTVRSAGRGRLTAPDPPRQAGPPARAAGRRSVGRHRLRAPAFRHVDAHGHDCRRRRRDAVRRRSRGRTRTTRGGYHELEQVKQLEHGGDVAWLAGARGKCVKVISFLLRRLPAGEHYRIVFVRRNLREVLASQRRMLERRGEPAGDAGEAEMERTFARPSDPRRAGAGRPRRLRGAVRGASCRYRQPAGGWRPR